MQEKKKYTLELVGCDDGTEIEVELNEQEVALVTHLAILFNRKSDCSCQPRLSIDGEKYGV